MKKIGYIHKYNDITEKGILVHNEGCIGKSTEVTVFSKVQCLSCVRENTLVFFTKDEDGAITDIEEASIFNFDRESLQYYTSSYNLNNKHKFGLSTYISFNKNEENIRRLIKEVEGDKNSSIHQRKRKRKYLYSPGLDFGGEEEVLSSPTQMKIDILDPKFWIVENAIKSGGNYYGSNCDEFIDLFNLLILKRRNYNEAYLERVRTSNPTYATLSSKGMIRTLCPELIQDDCVSNLWGILLNQFSEDVISKMFSAYPILQPVLSDSYCLNHIEHLTEKYGFPSIDVAERFLSHIVSKATTATKCSHARELLHTVQHCGVKHLDDEGIPLCMIEKVRLEELSNLLEKKITEMENYVGIQLKKINQCCYDSWRLLKRPIKNDTIIEIGRFCDKINSFAMLKELPDYLSCMEFMEEFNSLSEEAKNIFTTYLRSSLHDSIVFSLSHLNLSPSKLYMILDVFKSLELPWSLKIEELVNKKYSMLSRTTDLVDAYTYNYISVDVFTSEYVKLSKTHTSQQLIKDLLEDYSHLLPDEIVIHILRRVGKDVHDTQTCILPDNTTINSSKEFIEWIDKLCEYGYLCRSNAECIKLEFVAILPADERWGLFEDRLISSPGEDNIIGRLKEVYEYYGYGCFFNEWYFKEDCFQEQMVHDIQEVTDIKLVYAIVDALKGNYRNVIISSNNIPHTIRLYVWSLTPNEHIDWNGLKENLSELPISNQIRIFSYIFYLKAIGKVDENIDVLDKLNDMLAKGIEAAPLTLTTPNGTQFNYITILGVIVLFLEQKLQNSEEPIRYSQIEKIIGTTQIDRMFFIKAMAGFFDERLKITPIENWEEYKFVDFLRILKGPHFDSDSIYKINIEITRFLEDITSCTQDDLAQLVSHPLGELDIIDYTIDDEDESYYGDDEEDYYDEDYRESYQDEKTYDRYRGTWAQDVEGYSDDEIDDIFDGDPSAYWNID